MLMADTAGVGSDDDPGGDTDGDTMVGLLFYFFCVGTTNTTVRRCTAKADACGPWPAAQGTACTPRWADRPLPRLTPQTRRV